MLYQTYSNIELIIVNDCSTDNTSEILEYYQKKDSRVIVINNEVNKKLPASLNEGFSHASGYYYSWTSDDNIYHEDAIEVMVRELEKDSQYDLVYSDFNIVDLKGTLITTLYKEEPEYLKYVNCVGACFLYKKAIADVVGGYNTDYFLAEDYEYWIRIYDQGKMKHIGKVLYDYSIHDSSLTATRQRDIRRKTYEVKQTYFNKLRDRCESQSDIDKFYWGMLSLLDDVDEKKRIRKKYYNDSMLFAIHDIKRNVSNSLKYPFILIRAGIKKIIKEN